uniref:Uncharacterized protein n=1 Tax=Anopheles epiroticus TaxID=199890 RepID=A0A182P1U1_9DIPT
MDGWKQCVVTGLVLALVGSQLPPVGSNATETRPKSGGRDRSTGSTAIASLSSASIAAALASRHATTSGGGGSAGNSNASLSGNGGGHGSTPNGNGGKCNIAQLRCANGTCIPSSKFCDGNFDCLDKSDEPKSCTAGVLASVFPVCREGRQVGFEL